MPSRILLRPISPAQFSSSYLFYCRQRVWVRQNSFLAKEDIPGRGKREHDSSEILKITDHPAPFAGHIRVIALNSPHNKNAISQELLHKLDEEIQEIDYATRNEDRAWQDGEKGAKLGQGTRVLIIGSAVDGAFCAGADLKERVNMTVVETKSFLQRLRKTFRNIAQLGIPTISAVPSYAMGGGLELALATDFRIFCSVTKVAFPETRLGIIPGARGTVRLPQLVGHTRAADLILTGRRIGASEAFRIGLCDRLATIEGQGGEKMPVNDPSWRRHVMREAMNMATDICRGAPGAVCPAKRAIQGARDEAEIREYAQVLSMKDRTEALVAFRENRAPVFEGI
ncbi:MAG: hypothetical protein Q9167_007841 [Letrouitia subvulpina]